MLDTIFDPLKPFFGTGAGAALLFAAGLISFLYGMHLMTDGLKRSAGKTAENRLQALLGTPGRGLLAGMGITAVIQSSSAVTVMLIGLTQAGLTGFESTIGVIMGADIGTTITAWLLSLSGYHPQGKSGLVHFLNPARLPYLCLLIGILLWWGNGKKRSFGKICLGFGILLLGMRSMSSAALPLTRHSAFLHLLTALEHPLPAALTGFLFTGVIQSSSAAVGIIQSLSVGGAFTVQMALPLLVGINVGTCVTAILASLRAGRSAKRVAVVHILMKLTGAAVTLLLFMLLQFFVQLQFFEQPVDPVRIALLHTAFNVLMVAGWYPCIPLLIQVTEKILPLQEKPEP